MHKARRGRGRGPRAQKYRFGFLLHPAKMPIRAAVPESWRSVRLGPYAIRLHPETVHFATGEAVVLGPVIGRDGAAVTELIDELATVPPERIASVVGELVGKFAVIVLRGDGAHVFHDAFGSRMVFYSTDFPDVVASHADLLADATEAPPASETLSFMETKTYADLKVKYLPGDLTVHRNIFALVPNNAYVIGKGARRYWPLRPPARFEKDAFFSLLEGHFLDLVRLGSNRTFVLGVTGGVDSRLVGAGLVRHAKSFEGVTWQTTKGGYLRDQEIPAVDQTVSILSITHRYVMIDRAKTTRRPRAAASVSAAMAAVTGRNHVFVNGHGGEIIHGFYNVQPDAMTSASPAEFARLWRRRHPKRDLFAVRAFEGFWERANWDDVIDSGYDPNDLFYWEHRMGMWGASRVIQLDPAVECWVGLNSRPLYEASFGLDPRQRLTKALFAEGIRRFQEPLAAVPIHLASGGIFEPNSLTFA